MMFWLSAGVLLLLSCVSIFTVASVVGPVRRMRIATKRIADGEARVHVARGLPPRRWHVITRSSLRAK